MNHNQELHETDVYIDTSAEVLNVYANPVGSVVVAAKDDLERRVYLVLQPRDVTELARKLNHALGDALAIEQELSHEYLAWQVQALNQGRNAA